MEWEGHWPAIGPRDSLPPAWVRWGPALKRRRISARVTAKLGSREMWGSGATDVAGPLGGGEKGPRKENKN